MKISEQTIKILTNFATINPSISVKKGNVISTLSPFETIFAKATVQEEFPVDFCIYDLNNFLRALDFFDEPELNFKDTNVKFVEGNKSLTFTYADPTTIKTLKNNIKMPDTDIMIKLSENDVESVFKAAQALKVDDLSIISNGDSLSLLVHSEKNSSLGSFLIQKETSLKHFKTGIKLENLKILKGDYHLFVANEIVNLKNLNIPIEYWVASEVSEGI